MRKVFEDGSVFVGQETILIVGEKKPVSETQTIQDTPKPVGRPKTNFAKNRR